MADKVAKMEQKRLSKAKSREGERGQWWPCELKEFDMKILQDEGFIQKDSWRITKGSSAPAPEVGERIMTRAWIERGFSLTPSDFFLEVLEKYGLQPHIICPNAYTILSNFVTLCEGHLGIRPDLQLFQFYCWIKKETKDGVMCNCGSVTFVLQAKRIFPPMSTHESIRYWNAEWFYIKDLDSLQGDNLGPLFHQPTGESEKDEKVPEEEGEESDEDTEVYHHQSTKRPRAVTVGAEARVDKRPKPAIKKPSRKVHSSKAQPSPATTPSTPVPPTSLALGTLALQKTPPPSSPKRAQAAANSPKKVPSQVIPISSEHRQESMGRNFPETEARSGRQDMEIGSQVRAEATAKDAMLFTQDTGAPSPSSKPKAYMVKLFSKLSEAEKWELQQDLLNSMLQDETQLLHQEMHKVIIHQRSMMEKMADDVFDKMDKIEELEGQLHQSQGACVSLEAQLNALGFDFDTLKASYETLSTSHDDLKQRFKTAVDDKDEVDHKLEAKRRPTISANVDPLGFVRQIRERYPRDDLYKLAGESPQDLVESTWKKCDDLYLKDSLTCDIRSLIEKVHMLPEIVLDLQQSFARGAARMALAMCLARNPNLNLHEATFSVPPGYDAEKLLITCEGYDHRVAKSINHSAFYEKTMLPEDAAEEERLAKLAEIEAMAGDQASSDASSTEPADGASSPAKEVEK
ncbi:hypothetical protein ACQ4PT_067463 [Festuca glaucescens]